MGWGEQRRGGGPVQVGTGTPRRLTQRVHSTFVWQRFCRRNETNFDFLVSLASSQIISFSYVEYTKEIIDRLRLGELISLNEALLKRNQFLPVKG